MTSETKQSSKNSQEQNKAQKVFTEDIIQSTFLKVNLTKCQCCNIQMQQL